MSKELLNGIPLTTPFNNNTTLWTTYNSDGDIRLVGNQSIGCNYIPINPSGKTYYYRFVITKPVGNQVYLGFEQYDKDKTARTNNACVYFLANANNEYIKQEFKGIVNLATDGTNPTAFIRLRILNDWSNANGREMIVHNISLREVSSSNPFTIPQITSQGQNKTEVFVEGYSQASLNEQSIFYANRIIEY